MQEKEYREGQAAMQPAETTPVNVLVESYHKEPMNTENTPYINDNPTSGPQQQSAWGSQSQTQRQGAPFTNTLYRHPTDKMLGGVCGGLADYFHWDPALVRIIWLVATIVTGGGGLLAYLVLWGLLPVGTVQTGQQRPAAFALNERNIGRMAAVLIGLGGLWLLANLGILPGILRIFWWTVNIFFWPALLIGIGYLLLRGTGNTDLRADLNNWKNRFQGSTNGVKMPNSDHLKSGLSQFRERLPLRRSTSDRLFLGVCGGIGKQLGVDANLVRLLWAAFSVMSVGMGVFLYVALGLLLPEEKPATLAPYDHVQDVEVVEGTTPRVV
ncbi:MAG: PspC domain-containing protein [Caldilineaceae bacterium]|nr:PspC domain-containing protein [Caldilineaceae bacterium]